MSIGLYSLPGTWVYQRLTTAYPIFAGKFYPEVNNTSAQITDENAGFWLTYSFRNNEPTPTKSGVSALDEVTMLINIFVDPALSYDTLVSYQALVRTTLDGYAEATPAGSNQYVQACSFEDQSTGFNAKIGTSGVYFATQEYQVRISKS